MPRLSALAFIALGLVPAPAHSQLPVDTLIYYVTSLGETRAAAHKTFGQPVSTSQAAVPNRYSPVSDTVYTYRYRSAEIEFLRVTSSDKEFTTSVTLYAAPRPLPFGLRFGSSTRDGLTKALGKPLSALTTGDTLALTFQDFDATELVLVARLVKGTLRTLTWQLAVD
jgi:hypothetical protein